MLSSDSLSIEIQSNGVANLAIDLKDEKVNKLSSKVLLEIEKAINFIDGNKAIRILIISSEKKNNFIAGADINEIRAITTYNEAYEKVSRGQEIISKIEKLKIPTIALINGSCLGGGLELALACKYRVCVDSEKTILGLPEVNLGIIPGFGGTQRLPKLVGLKESLKIILSGKAIDARKAFKIGLVDHIINENFLENNLSKFVIEILNHAENNDYLIKRNKAIKKRFITENILFLRFLIIHYSREELYKKTKGNYPAPFVALEVIRKTYNITNFRNGYKEELKEFCNLAIGDVSKNLIDLFFISEELKKVSIADENDKIEIKKINSSAVIGAGIMGGGIAWLFSNKDIAARMKDISQNAISLGYLQVIKIFNQLKKIRKYNENQISNKFNKITSTLDYSGFKNLDIVIEAVVENMSVKKKVLSELESNVSDNCIIVTNTSSLSVTEMASALKYPHRFAGFHFFNPVNKMPLVEVIPHATSSKETIESLLVLAKKLGKTPILVKDSAGFLINRILLPFMNEASYILQEGSDVIEIDKYVEEFGMPMGPFTLADTVGIDVGVKVAKSLYESFKERMKISPLLIEIHDNHRELLGKKSKAGFYLYFDEKKKPLNPEIKDIIKKVAQDNNIASSYISKQEIVDRLFLTMVNEAARCLEEGVVSNHRQLDMAMIMGTGFPAFRGGVLKFADNYGIRNIVEKLEIFESKYGARFKPSTKLVEMEKNNQKFYN